MPIISPGVEDAASANTSPQIVSSTLKLTNQEFKRAYKLVKKIAKGKLEMATLFGVPPTQELHQFVFRIDLMTVAQVPAPGEADQNVADDRLLTYQHRKYVMAAEGKLRSLFLALDRLG